MSSEDLALSLLQVHPDLELVGYLGHCVSSAAAAGGDCLLERSTALLPPIDSATEADRFLNRLFIDPPTFFIVLVEEQSKRLRDRVCRPWWGSSGRRRSRRERAPPPILSIVSVPYSRSRSYPSPATRRPPEAASGKMQRCLGMLGLLLSSFLVPGSQMREPWMESYLAFL